MASVSKKSKGAKARELIHPCKRSEHSKEEYLSGGMIEPLKLEGSERIKEFVENVLSNSGYNARRLAEACDCAKRMLSEQDTVVCLTLAGAMTPIGMSGPIIKMMELGFVDFIISTGANIYHDLHRAFDFPMVKGESEADDSKLNREGIARIYDVFIDESTTLLGTDAVIVRLAESLNLKEPISTAGFHKLLGEVVLKNAPHPEKSLVAQAAKHNVPVYTSSPGDSSIGMNLVVPWLFGHKILLDPVKDIIETTAIVGSAKKNGAIIVGGGSPKNFYMQTQPTLWQILNDNRGGHDYFIQLTTDSPHFGGLSGATPQEAKSWGKLKEPGKNTVVVYSCASLTFPLLCQYVRSAVKPRKKKELLKKVGKIVEELRSRAYRNAGLKKMVKKHASAEGFKKVYGRIWQ